MIIAALIQVSRLRATITWKRQRPSSHIAVIYIQWEVPSLSVAITTARHYRLGESQVSRTFSFFTDIDWPSLFPLCVFLTSTRRFSGLWVFTEVAALSRTYYKPIPTWTENSETNGIELCNVFKFHTPPTWLEFNFRNITSVFFIVKVLC
jgi:hypothetical protein